MTRKHQSIKFLFHVFSFALIFCFNTNAYASDSSAIISTSVYQDATRQLTIKEIQEIDSIGLFKSVNNKENLGFSSDMTWVKVVVHNPGGKTRNLLLRWKESLTHYVRMYEIGKDTIRESISGHSIDDSEKEIVSNAICFPLVLPAKSTTTCFLQIDSPYNKEINVSLVNRQQLDTDERIYNIFAGAIFCSLLVISLYNLFLGISLRDSLYFHFVAANMVDTVAATTMLGLMPTVFPFIPYNTSPFSTTLSVGLFGIFSANFVIQFLKLKQQDKGWYWVLVGTIIGEFIAIIHGTISYYVYNGTYILIPLGNLIFVTLTFVAVVVAYKKGSRDARFLLIGWFVLWFGLMIKLLTIVGVIPSSWFSEYFVYTSGVIESILLSFALADRYHHLQQDKLQLEIDLRTKEKDLSIFATDTKISYDERKKFLMDLHELAENEPNALRNKLRSLILDLTQKLNREEKFIHKANNIHILNSEFEDKLRSAFPQLGKNDLEICGYIKLNLSVKEIAEIRRTSEGAIKMARHRLKRKLFLEDKSLEDFIQSEF